MYVVKDNEHLQLAKPVRFWKPHRFDRTTVSRGNTAQFIQMFFSGTGICVEDVQYQAFYHNCDFEKGN